MTEVRRAYWDSCIWLGLINGEHKRERAIDHVYNSAKAGGHELWTSTLSLVEVHKIRGEQDKPFDIAKLDRIQAMFQQDFVKLVQLDMEVAKLARDLLRKHENLTKANDALHLASALTWSLDVLHTYDGQHLLVFDGKLTNKSGRLLRIVPPEHPPDGPLFVAKP